MKTKEIKKKIEEFYDKCSYSGSMFCEGCKVTELKKSLNQKELKE